MIILAIVSLSFIREGKFHKKKLQLILLQWYSEGNKSAIQLITSIKILLIIKQALNQKVS